MSKQTNISDLINPKKSKLAGKILDYYDGNQDEHFTRLMNDPNMGRKDWMSRGIIPRTRNILKMVVDKSGLLFNDKAPTLDVHVNGEVNIAASAVLQMHLEKIDWIEFFTNFDGVVRMLKTACILVQYDTESGQLVFDILSQQNAAVVLNPATKQPKTLIYRTSCEAEYDPLDQTATYRVFTPELIQDISVDKNGQESVVQVQPNPFGIIPIVSFHDTNTPRTDFWNAIPTDLIQVNDMYNLHITDSEYAASWAKLKTLFTNARISGGEDSNEYSVQQVYGQALPTFAPNQSSMIGGPSKVIQIDSSGVDNVFIEYKGPEVDLLPMDQMVNKWVADFAQDWDVNIKLGTDSNVDSGFKLIVEEMANLALRKKRARMFEAGFKRLYKVIAVVLNFNLPGALPEDGELFAQFASPILPVNEKDQEMVWSVRIAEGRATRVDYFMAVFGMSKTEAQAKVVEIDAETGVNGTTPVQKLVQKYTAKV